MSLLKEDQEKVKHKGNIFNKQKENVIKLITKILIRQQTRK